MLNIAIFGSCISRDVLSCFEPGSFRLQLYSARCSFGSLFSHAPFNDDFSDILVSPFQRRTLRMDIEKGAIDTFSGLNPDVILVDLIDERFDLVQGVNGGRCTYSSELRKSGFRFGKNIRISSESEVFFEFWSDGWRKFVKLMDVRGMRDRVIVNKSYYCQSTVSGLKFDPDVVARANSKLQRMYDVQGEDLSPMQFIEYTPERYCPDDHVWGAEPFHFDAESNSFAAQWIMRFAANRIASNSRAG